MKPHSDTGTRKRFALSIGITLIIFIAELIGGLWSGSLALLSDAAHVFMDVVALALSFIALRLSALPVDDRHTYGWHRLEVLAALANGLTLLVIAVGIGWEAIDRFQHPQPIRGPEMLAIAAIGLVANLAVAYILREQPHSHAEGEMHAHNDVNVESAFLHVLGDAVSSVGVIAAALVIGSTGWLWVDPLMSIAIGLLIMFSSYRVLRRSIHILIEGVPEGMSARQVGDRMAQVKGVNQVHDLHIWSICSGHIALSAHVTLTESHPAPQVLAELNRLLHDEFGIEHTTIQVDAAIPEKASSCEGCGPVVQVFPTVGK